MKDIALVIMAAGIGSRYGAGIKQLQKVGPKGEIIIDYSIHDALEAGFNRVIFIIRKDIEEEFKEVIGSRIEKICPVEYVFQDKNDLPEGFTCPKDRTKPWGTGQAVLACRHILDVPFVVINADDYYGKEAFVKIHNFLTTEIKPNGFCMAGFVLKNTLSDNGGVTRGVCKMDENSYLTDVVETHDIVKTADGAEAKGEKIDVESLVSMNMWGLAPEYMDMLRTGFVDFFRTVAANPLKAEYLLPIHIGQLLREDKVTVKVLSTQDKWFGVTYQEDKEFVIESFKKLIADGVYSVDLFSDL